MEKEYNGFKYAFIGGDKWKIRFPNGHKFSDSFQNEDEVKQRIDAIIAQVATNG